MSDAGTDARRVEAQAQPLRDLIAENERLREALREIKNSPLGGYDSDFEAFARNRARAALAAVPEERS